MPTELAPQYDPKAVEEPIYERWLSARAFAATPDERENRYVVMMPLPNVTGALHMGHAMDNVMQDLLVRWHRMKGDNTLWMPGTDHAGIATQSVVERRLKDLEGKTRHDIGREALIQRIWDWKDQYQARIVRQQQAMGCSCDWDRQRFTMDDVCARAVRHTFFRMFEDALIYRGKRLVNWDCHLQTAVADDEIYRETKQGHFWHLRYPVIDPKPGEPTHIHVATTRPETMLGDTAVACHPDPTAAFEVVLHDAREKVAGAPAKERAAAERELARLEGIVEADLPRLIQLVEMARDGRKLMLPLQNREIPLICDEWAKPHLGSGCVKITPAHDPNDYEVWGRHADEIDIINILEIDGTLNKNAGAYQGIDRFEARKKVVADLDAQGLLVEVEDRVIELGHSDRSKTIVEPFWSDQWFVRMADVEGGIVCGRGTDKEHRADGLAQAAIDAVAGDWRSPTGRKLTFHPDADRYGGTYLNWLQEKRDWCISRQLWWGHRIPIWHTRKTGAEIKALRATLDALDAHDDACVRVDIEDDASYRLADLPEPADDARCYLLVGLLDEAAEEAVADQLAETGVERDPDVLDTWFSSALWPHSTLGWPDPATAPIDEGQSEMGAAEGRPDTLSTYYPGSCLVTGRDIITLWVARMVVTGLYNLGDLPFTDCFIHANIQDGEGHKMSKSAGNGIDPVDIIDRYGTDALRYVICELQTGSQDIRLPVFAISPYTGEMIDLGKAKHGKTKFTYIDPTDAEKREFDVLGTMDDVPQAKLVSDRFEVGRNFCNKLWNAGRFALMNLEGVSFRPLSTDDLAVEDRFILSRLTHAAREVESALSAYNPSHAINAAREFFWGDLCDWYLEIIKPRIAAGEASGDVAKQVLAACIDQSLRLLHPFVPFITEELWEHLNAIAPTRGIDRELPASEHLILAAFPEGRDEWHDAEGEARFATAREVTTAIRDIRSKYNIAPKERLDATLKCAAEREAELTAYTPIIRHMAGLASLELSADAERAQDAATAVVGDLEVYVAGVIDLEEEKKRLTKQKDDLTKRLEGTRKKLGNENFTSRAKPEIVERERTKATELEAELATVEANLAALG